MQVMSSILTSSISQSQATSGEAEWTVSTASKEKIFLFLSKMEAHSQAELGIPTKYRDIFELSAKSFFSVEVSSRGETMGLFFYGLDSDLDVDKWALPIPIGEFDFSGSLFLTWFWILSPFKKVKEQTFKQNLRYVFSKVFRLNYVLYESSQFSNPKHFAFLQTADFAQDFGKHFRLISRPQILPPLIIRVAREEDHDDLVKICDHQSELKTHQHGNYFIAELIASQNEDKICLVAENEDSQVVGMMLVSLRMDLSVLNSHFDLQPFDLFCKSDFSESVFRFHEMGLEMQRVKSEVQILKSKERLSTLRQLCSFPLNVRLLQQFIVDNVQDHISDFEAYLQANSIADPSAAEIEGVGSSKNSSKAGNLIPGLPLKDDESFKKKNINNFILGKLIDKHLKHLKMSQPDSAFAEADDFSVQTWVLSPREFLFRVLCHFGLPGDYLDGGGHWKLWAQRLIEKKMEEQRNKNFMGKRRNKYAKKRGHDTRVKEIDLPPGFDIEPFVNGLRRFAAANLETRQQICLFFGAHQKTLLKLFCNFNGELDESKELPFHLLLEAFHMENMEEELDKQTQTLILPVLEAFGHLKSRSEMITVKEKRKFIFRPAKEVANNSTLKSAPDFQPRFQLNRRRVVYVKLKDLFEAIEKIAYEDAFYKNRGSVLDDLDVFFNSEQGLLDKAVKRHYSNLRLEHFDLVRRAGINRAIKDVPPGILNAGCISLFFMDSVYQSRATDFLPFVFSRVRSRDYLIMTQPQIANETVLLQHFQKVPQKSNSNFGHSLYIFHRSNLFSQFLKVQPAFPDEFAYLKRKFFAVESGESHNKSGLKTSRDMDSPSRGMFSSRGFESAPRTRTRDCLGTPNPQVDSVVHRNREAVREIFRCETTRNSRIDSEMSKVRLRFQQPTFTSALQTITVLNAFSVKNASRAFEFPDEKKTSNGFECRNSKKARRRRVGKRLMAIAEKEESQLEERDKEQDTAGLDQTNSDEAYLKLVFETPEMGVTNVIGLVHVSKNTRSMDLFERFDLRTIMDPKFLTKPDFLRLREMHVNPLFLSFKNFLLREALRINRAHVLVIAPDDLHRVENVMPLLSPIPRLPEKSFFYKDEQQVGGKGYYQTYKGLRNSLNYFFDQEDQEAKPTTPKSDSLPTPPRPLLSLKLSQLSTQKTRINIRLVVVGNSTTSVGVLKHLLELRDLDFNNITVLSTKFLNADWFLNTSGDELESSLSRVQHLFLEKKTRLIQGRMVSLDRKNKVIHAENLVGQVFKIKYDYLVITTGLVDKTYQLLKQQGVFSNVFSLRASEEASSQNLQNMSNTSGPNSENKNNLLAGLSSVTGDKPAPKTGLEGATSSFFMKNKTGKPNEKEFKSSTAIADPTEQTTSPTISVNTDFFVSADDLQSDLRRVLLSDPEIQSKSDLLAKLSKQKSWAGKLLHRKIPQNAVLYGESPQIFALLESFLRDFDLNLSKISLLLPPRAADRLDLLPLKTEPSNLHSSKRIANEEILRKMDHRVDFPVLFENTEIKEFYLALLEYFGVNVLRDYEVLGLCELENSLLVRYNSELEKKRQMAESGEPSLESCPPLDKENADPLKSLFRKQRTRNRVCPEFMARVKALRGCSYFFDLDQLPRDVLDFLNEKHGDMLAGLEDLKPVPEPVEGDVKPGKQRFGYTKEVNEEGDDLLQDAIVFMGNTFDVGNTVFRAIQDNGLVYNGRLIVTNNFRTIDQFIYACGKISEFSQRYLTKGLGRSLKLDKFDGFEVGVHFARQFEAMLRDEPFVQGEVKSQKSKLNWIDIWISQWTHNSQLTSFPRPSKPLSTPGQFPSHSPPHSQSNRTSEQPISSNRTKSQLTQESQRKEWSQLLNVKSKQMSFEGQIPHLEKPKAFKMRLFPGYYFVQVKKPFRGLLDLNQPRYFESTNTLNIDIDYWVSESSGEKQGKLESRIREKIEAGKEAKNDGEERPFLFSSGRDSAHVTKTTHSSLAKNSRTHFSNTASKESNKKEGSKPVSLTPSLASNSVKRTPADSMHSKGPESINIAEPVNQTHTSNTQSKEKSKTGSSHFSESTNKLNSLDASNIQNKTIPLTEIPAETLESNMIREAPTPGPIESGHYFLLEFDEHHQVSKIEYFGRDEPSLECLVNLCGLHRSFFNLMFERRDAGLVDDFATFISQEWARFLGHPVFPQLATYARGLFHLTFQKHHYSRKTLEMAYSEGLAQIRRRLMAESNLASNRTDSKQEGTDLGSIGAVGQNAEFMNDSAVVFRKETKDSGPAHLNLKDSEKDQQVFQENLDQYQTEQYDDKQHLELTQRVTISKTEHVWDQLLSELPFGLKKDLLMQIEACITRFRPIFAKRAV